MIVGTGVIAGGLDLRSFVHFCDLAHDLSSCIVIDTNFGLVCLESIFEQFLPGRCAKQA